MYSVLKLHMHIVLGFTKCGSMSLNQYLIDKYGFTNVGWREDILYTIEDQMRLFKEKFGDPRDIPRDEGQPNPIPPWHLEELMEPWMKYNPTIYKLEEISKMKGFPKLNVTSTGYRRIK